MLSIESAVVFVQPRLPRVASMVSNWKSFDPNSVDVKTFKAIEFSAAKVVNSSSCGDVVRLLCGIGPWSKVWGSDPIWLA